MRFRIESIDLFIRRLPPDRIVFSIGNLKQARRPDACGLCRLILKTDDGRRVTGCSGDRPSYGWLDKRPGLEPAEKLRDLVSLLESGRDAWLEQPAFDSVFDHWLDRHRTIMALGAAAGHEPLSASYASAFIERAVIDAVCRATLNPVGSAIQQGILGLRPGAVHPELEGRNLAASLPSRPRTRFFIRHTVGLQDALTAADLTARIDDGEPETLEEYAQRDGLRYFKIKISGDPDADIGRLRRIWEVIPKSSDTGLTLDGNESYEDLAVFSGFVDRLAAEAPGLFDHLLFIEQPLTRRLTFDPASKPWIERVSEKKPLVIDEADGTLESFRHAREIGYAGASHKNCKGFFKSLMNHALCEVFEERDDREAFLSAEDLSLMPIVPLHQDFAALGLLGIEHCERNGHHYARGLSHLTAGEKAMMLRDHPDLYSRRSDEVYLNIADGAVSCASLQVPGFGVKSEPDWQSMEPMSDWLAARDPA